MTALKDIAKIETTGLWRVHKDAQRIEVFVALGDDSLIITDISETALSHWALAAVRRRNPNKRPALFNPGSESDEELEIEDETMIDAIERIRTSIDRARPHPGRLRYLTLGVVAASLVTMSLFWVPKALRDHTLSVLPVAQRVAIGQEMLVRITSLTGTACAAPRSLQALGRLNDRVLPGIDARLVVLPNLPRPAMHLPGDHFVLSADLLDPASEPEAVAGQLLTEFMRAQMRDSLREYLDFAGFRETFRLLTRSETNPETLRRYVDLKLTRPQLEIADDTVIEWFSQLRLPTTPYAWSVDPSGESVLTLIEADPYANTPAPEVLSDTEWLTLTNICQ